MLSVKSQSVEKEKSYEVERGLKLLSRPFWRRSLTTLCLSSLVSIGFGAFTYPAFADTDDMTKLEIRFFQHNYPKDSQEARLDRLEKMVFGEVKTGSEGERLSKLVGAVPAGEPTSSASAPSALGGTPSSQSDSLVDEPRPRSNPQATSEDSAPSAPRQRSTPGPTTADNDSDEPVKTDEKYPAVTAIEQKTLGKDYAGEAVNKRLARLETKVFGKPSSNSVDLSDRVDALKSKTGIDVARSAPKGSDWADDDDDIAVSPRANPRPRGDNYQASSNPREDAMSFSGRNLQDDMLKAFGTRGGGSSGFGSGGNSSSGSIGSASGSGSYGMGSGGSSYPVSPPSYSRNSSPSISENPGGMGLNQQVSALESEIFQKNWPHDPLPTRLNRLEATVFPSDKTLTDKSLPERVANLVAKIPISTPGGSRKVARATQSDDLDDLMNGGTSSAGSSMNQTSMTQQQPKKSGGLGKIMNSLSSMMSGGGGNGYGYTGGYPMSGGALAVDPSTGMLYDPTSGNLINPTTGQVVGRRASAYNSYGTGYGSTYNSPYGYNNGGMNGGFNNGFSPYGARSGVGLGNSFGINSGGGMGMGGMRMGGMGGMWP